MSRTKTKQNLSWRTLNRRAAEIEKKNKGRPTKQSKSLRTQAANLRSAERSSAQVRVALKHALDGQWKVDDTTPVTPPIPTYTAVDPDNANDSAPINRTYIYADILSVKYEAREELYERSVMATMAAFENGKHTCGDLAPWVLTRAEMDALMYVLNRNGYTAYGKSVREHCEPTKAS